MRAGSRGIDHADTPSIDEAASWLAARPEPPRPLVTALHSLFGLTAPEACEAAARAADIRRTGSDNGNVKA